MKKDFKEFYKESEQLNESGLAKVTAYMDKHDCGIISASRKFLKDGRELTKKENRQRTRVLQMELMDLRYGLIPMKGVFIENFGSTSDDPKLQPHEVLEDVYFVVDTDDKGNLLKDLMKLGKEWYQDSIAFIKKGEKSMSMYGTNDSSENFFLGGIRQYPIREMGKEAMFMTKVHGRPFNFQDPYNLNMVTLPEGMGRQVCNSLAKHNWETWPLNKEDLRMLNN